MSNDVMTLFHNHRIPGKCPNSMIDVVLPHLEKTGYEDNNILRWEEDGGSVFELETPFPQTGGIDTTTIKIARVARVHARINILIGSQDSKAWLVTKSRNQAHKYPARGEAWRQNQRN